MGIAAAASDSHMLWVLLWVPSQRCHIKKNRGQEQTDELQKEIKDIYAISI